MFTLNRARSRTHYPYVPKSVRRKMVGVRGGHVIRFLRVKVTRMQFQCVGLRHVLCTFPTSQSCRYQWSGKLRLLNAFSPDIRIHRILNEKCAGYNLNGNQTTLTIDSIGASKCKQKWTKINENSEIVLLQLQLRPSWAGWFDVLKAKHKNHLLYSDSMQFICWVYPMATSAIAA